MIEREPEDHARRKDPWTSHAAAKDPVGNRWTIARWILYRCFWHLAQTVVPPPGDTIGLAACRNDYEAIEVAGYHWMDDRKRRRVGTLRELGLIFVPVDQWGNEIIRVNPHTGAECVASRLSITGVDYMTGQISWAELVQRWEEKKGA